MIRREATTVLAFILRVDGRQIQLVGDIGDEAGQMVFWQPILQCRRKQERLIEAANSKALVHTLMIADMLCDVKNFIALLSPTGS